jgi:NAD(P)-dependent dehydrogenase (short-subunit alcohol dehydrogenase family)
MPLRRPSFDFEGTTAVVTGASSEPGAEFTRQLAATGEVTGAGLEVVMLGDQGRITIDSQFAED